MKKFGKAQHNTILDSMVAIVDLREIGVFGNRLEHPADRRTSSNYCGFVC